MSSDPVALEPGTLIGSYEIVRPLGKGGMGIVFEALSRINQAPVALKTVRTANPYLLSSIRREILRLRRLSHPGVVRILDDGTFGGLPYYAMELLQGRTLEHEIELRSDSGPSSLRSSERASAITQPSTPTSAPSPQSSDRDTSLAGIDLATVDGMGSPASPNVPILVKGARGPLSAQAIPEFLDAIQKLCDALVYIHGEGVVHRDIKPWNFPLLDLPKFLRGEFRGNTAQLIPRFSRRVNKKIPDGTFGIGLQVRQIHWDFLAYRRYCAFL